MTVLVPIMVLSIAVTGIVSWSIIKMQRLRMEEARLRAGDSSDANELAHQVSALQQEMLEVQERLDFAERMLAQGRTSPELPPAAPPSDSP